MGQGGGSDDSGREAGEGGAYGAQLRLLPAHACIKEEEEDDEYEGRITNNEMAGDERAQNRPEENLRSRNRADFDRGDDRGGIDFDNADIGKK